MRDFDVKEITRTPRYMVMTRQRGTALFAHLLTLRTEVVKARDYAASMRRQLQDETDLLNQALHQLARERGKEPRRFTRTWLANHREVKTTDKERR